MALTTCKECGATVSTLAAACPTCGAPRSVKPGAFSTGCGCLIVLALVVILANALKPASGRKNSATKAPGYSEAQSAVNDAQQLADRIAVEAQQKANLDTYMGRIAAYGDEGAVVRRVSVAGAIATITVDNSWHLNAYQNRLQAAQNLWRLWANIVAKNEPDRARISIVDLNGNEVGGSRALAGSLIWVQKY